MEPSFQNNSSQPPITTSHKRRWLIIGVIIAAVLIATVLIVVLFTRQLPKSTSPDQQTKPPASEAFKFESSGTPMTYAGAPVYDPCNFVSLATLKKTIPNFTKLLDTVGTSERASQPVMIQHNYIDRVIAEPLGRDASPREPGTVVNEKPGARSVDPYISLADSSCTYGQTGDQSLIQSSLINHTFAQVYITQKPTPLSPQFLNFIQAQKKFTDHNYKDIDVYAMPEKDGNGYFTSVFVKKDQSAAVIFKTGIEALLNEAGDDIATALSKAPTGPLKVIYPEPYKQLSSACHLLSADDFMQYTGKPTGALADEAIILTEVGGNSARRECERLEIDRDILKSNIARSKVTLMQARDSESAKQIMQKERESKLHEATPLKARIALGDEAFIKKGASVSNLENPYGLVIRKDANIITIEVGLDKQDASADAFEGRMIPVAQKVLKNFETTRLTN